MIVGEHNRDNDIDVNPWKSSPTARIRQEDEAVVLTPVRPMTLEHALHFVREDELVEALHPSAQGRAERAQALPVRRQEKDRQPWK